MIRNPKSLILLFVTLIIGIIFYPKIAAAVDCGPIDCGNGVDGVTICSNTACTQGCYATGCPDDTGVTTGLYCGIDTPQDANEYCQSLAGETGTDGNKQPCYGYCARNTGCVSTCPSCINEKTYNTCEGCPVGESRTITTSVWSNAPNQQCSFTSTQCKPDSACNAPSSGNPPPAPPPVVGCTCSAANYACGSTFPAACGTCGAAKGSACPAGSTCNGTTCIAPTAPTGNNCACGGLGQDTCNSSTSARNAYQCGNRDGSLCLPGLERDSNNKCNNPPGSTSCLPNGTSCTSDPSCCGGDCWGGGGFICRTDPGPGGICQNGTDYECKFNDQSCGDAQVGETNSNPDLSGPSYCICQLDAGAKVWRGVPQCCTGSCPANGSSVACGTPVTNGCGTSCNIGSGTYCAGIAACVSGSCQVAPNAPTPVCHGAGSNRTDDLCNGEASQSVDRLNVSAKNMGPSNSGEPHLHRYQITRAEYPADFLDGSSPSQFLVTTPFSAEYSNNINEIYSDSVVDILSNGGRSLEADVTYLWRTQSYSPSTGLVSSWSIPWTFRYAPIPPFIETVGGDVHSNQ